MRIPGLYIHIPFCLRKCHYCDFYSVTTTAAISRYLEALFTEMKMYRGRFDRFDTVYLGGGTPSILSAQQLGEVLANVKDNFDLLPYPEITIEANPGDLNQDFLESLLEIGINRLNIGVQSLDEQVLGFLGRRHSSNEAVSAIENSRGAGFRNLGIDLIYGVPGQAIGSWSDTLERAASFEPEHLSCYQLTLEPGTPLGIKYQKGEFSLPDEHLQRELFMKTSEALEGAGYAHYEVSNFARGMTFASRHNQKYWDHTPYLGLGPAAHSFHGDQRWWNHRSLEKYVHLLKGWKLPIEGAETLTMEQLGLESLYLGLRTKIGVNLDEISNHVEEGFINQLLTEELVTIQDGFLCPTRSGLAVADGLTTLFSSLL